MKKMVFVWLIVIAFLASVSCAGPGKVMKARATVAEYQPGKMIKVPSGLPVNISKGTDTVRNPDYVEYYVCDVTPETKVSGDIKPGTRVLMEYRLLGPRGPGYQCQAVSIDRIFD